MPEALALARLSRSEADARNALVQRASGACFDWGGQPAQLALSVLDPQAPLQADPGEWVVAAQWGGAPFELLVPEVAAQAWIASRFAGLDIGPLPDDLLAGALEVASQELLQALSSLQRGDAELTGLRRGPQALQPWPHGFVLELQLGEQVLRARLAAGSLGLMLMAGLVAQRPARPNALQADEVPVLLRAEIGFTRLSAAQLASLRVGDAVLVQQVFLTPERELWLGHEDWGLRVHCSDAGLTVSTAFTQGGFTMPDEAPTAAADAPAVALDALPLRLAFDLGERSISLGELRQLQVGQALDLGRPLSAAVSLRVNGALVGTGELVEIDGRLGVTLTTLSA